MLMFGKKRDDNGEKLYRYSIRKYHFGAASVAIAALIFFANGVAKADMAVSPATANSTHQTADGGGGDASGDSGSVANPNDPAITTNSTAHTTDGISTGTTSVENPVASDSSKRSENTESTTSNVSEKTEIPTVTTDKVQGAAISTEAIKVNVTDLKTALAELESKVASITDEAKKVKLNAVIVEAKKVLEDKNATQEQIDSQVTLVKDAVKSVQELDKKVDEPKPSEKDRSAEVEASNRETSTPSRSVRGRRGRTTEVQPADSESTTPKVEAATSNKETVPKALPTYTNGAGTYKLAEEMKNIISIMKANGADETTVAAVKANYDNLNDTLGAYEDGVLSEADFAVAKANLTAARDAVEKVLDKKFEEYARTVNPDARSRQARQARETGLNFQNSREYYFEDGKTGISPYSKYTYVFHNYRPTNILDFEHQPISNAEKYIHARVAPTDNGFLWTISVNAGRFSNTTNDSYWFTIPKGQTYKAGTARVDAQNLQGSTPYYGDGTIEGAMRQAGLRDVNRGANLKGVVRYGKFGANAYWTDDFKSLATQSVDALTDKGLYLPTLAQDSEKQLAQAKFDKINKKGGDLFYFEQPDNIFKYTITFETEGAPNDPDKNDPEELVYAAGFKGVTRGDKVYRVLVNQWHAVTDSELRDIDRYRMTLKNGGTFIVNQGKYYNKLWPYADALGPKGWYGSKNLNSDIKKVDGIITAGDQANFTAVDFFSYVNYKLRDGKDFEGMKFEANNHGQKFTFYREDGTEITTKQLGAEAGGTPGKHTFYYKRVFTSDGSSDNGQFTFLVKPNNPVFNPTMKLAGDKQTLTASGGTKGIPMTLFREYTDATGTHVVPVETKEADNNGTVTFDGENNGGVTLEKGKYFVRTVINTDSYKDYSGKTQTTLESDPATEDKKFEVVEPPVVKINGQKLTENAEDNQFIIYKGANFNPTFQVENDGKQVNYLKATNIPNGVWFNNVNGRDQEKTNMVSGSTFTLANNTVDNIAKNGEATVTVRNHKNQEKVYKFKYIIADVQPKDTPKEKLVGETIGNPHNFVKAVVNGNEGDQYFPKGMSFTWETNNNKVAGEKTALGEAGQITNYNAKVTFPNNGPFKKIIDNVEYTIYVPSPKKIPVTFNVTDNVAPTVKMANPADNATVTLSENESAPSTIRIFRGATLNIPLSMYDNDSRGKVNLKYESGLPSGVTLNGGPTISKTGAVETNQVTATIDGKVAANAELGIKTVTFKVSDDQGGNVNSGNKATLRFKVEVVDLDFEEGKGEIRNDGTLVVKGNKGISLNDSNTYLRTTNGPVNNDGFFPSDMKFRFIQSDGTLKNNVIFNAPGKHQVKAAAYFPVNNSSTNGVEKVPARGVTGDNVSELVNRSYLYKNIEVQIKPTAPTITPANGDVTITPATEDNVNKFEFKYTNNNNNPTVQTVTATKVNNRWTLSGQPTDGVTINEKTGVVTIKDREVKDATSVTAKAVTTDATGSLESDVNTATTNAGERELPKFTFDETNTTVENGVRTVYVTPTESNHFKLGTFSDNSNKLIEARISEKNNIGNDLAFGLAYTEKFTKTPNTEKEGSRDIIVTGTLDKTNNGNKWTNNFPVATRYAVATDAAGNELRNQSDTPSNPTRVVFKVLTQATKYVPTVEKQLISKDITASGASLSEEDIASLKNKLKFTAEKGTVKIDKNTPELQLTVTNRSVQKDTAGYYVIATVAYPDGSSEEVRVPLTTTKANLSHPEIGEVSIKMPKNESERDKVPAEQRGEVINHISYPTGEPVPNNKAILNEGSITTEKGEKVVTVQLTYDDTSTKEVKVPLLEVNPMTISNIPREGENSVSIIANNKVEVGDKIYVNHNNREVVFTKIATGFNASDAKYRLTGNGEDLEFALANDDKFHVGEVIKTHIESHKNNVVSSVATETVVGFNTVKKTPVVDLEHLSSEEILKVKEAIREAHPLIDLTKLEVSNDGVVKYNYINGDGQPNVLTLWKPIVQKPAKPIIQTNLKGKANLNTPVDVEVTVDPSKGTDLTAILYDKNNHEIGSGKVNSEGKATIHVSTPIPVGTVTAKVKSNETTEIDNYSDSSDAKEVTLVESKEPTIAKEKQDPDTGAVTYKVTDPDNGNYPQGSTVTINGNNYEVTAEGTITVPNDKLPDAKTNETPKVQESGKLPKTANSVEVPAKLVSAKGNPAVDFIVKLPLPIVVPDSDHLTPQEIEKLVDEVKKSNPDTIVTADDKGNVTVTDQATGESVLIPVKDLTVQDFTPVTPTDKVPVKDLNNLSKDEQDKVKESVEKANPGKDVIVASDGNVTITNPETNVTHNIPRDELLFAYAKGESEVQPDVPEFNGGVNGDPEIQEELPEFNGGVNGEPEIQEELPKFNGGVNTPDSPIHERPDFAGGVNGELPDPAELPKVKLLITKWIDENGNELKPADAKAPTVLGEANEAFEHGEIEGYVFVRTETKGDVVTHIFRKVSPVIPTGDGQQGSATPSADTNPRPDTATPAEVPATQPAEQPSQTVEVPAQLPNEVSETDSSVSQPQAVLPNTGTQEDRATGAFGILSLLGAFGLLFAKKKKDDEEEA